MSIARALGHITTSPHPTVFQDHVFASRNAASDTTAPALATESGVYDFGGAYHPAFLPSVSRLIRRPA